MPTKVRRSEVSFAESTAAIRRYAVRGLNLMCVLVISRYTGEYVRCLTNSGYISQIGLN